MKDFDKFSRNLRELSGRALRITAGTMVTGARAAVKSATEVKKTVEREVKDAKLWSILFESNPIDDFANIKLEHLKQKHNVPEEVHLAYDRAFSNLSPKVSEFSIHKLYEMWAKELNAYILFSIFGDLIKSEISIIGNQHDNPNPEHAKIIERELVAKVVSLYTSLNLITTNLNYLSVYLPLYLNDSDKKWCECFFNDLRGNHQIMGNSFDSFGRSLNFTINNLLKYVREVIFHCSKVGSLLKSREKSVLDEIDLIDIVVPIRIISDWRNISSKFGGFVESQQEKELREYGPIALNIFQELCRVFLSPFIIEVSKASYVSISNIISRDLKLYNKMPADKQTQMSKALFERWLKLMALSEKKLNQEGDIAVKDIISLIYDRSSKPDYSYLIPIEY